MNTLASFWAVIAPYAITGGIVSLIVQATKSAFEKSGHKALLAIGVSVVAGVIVQFIGFVPTNWLTTIAAVLAAANTWYLLVLQWIETPTLPPTPQPTSTPPQTPAA